MDLKQIPKELLENRDMIECNFIFMFYKDLSLIDDYQNVVNGDDIITDDGQIFFGIAQNMRKAGYTVIDNISLETFLEGKETMKKYIDQCGGYHEIKTMTDLVNTDNLNAAYDELLKSNLLIRLNAAGFDVISKLKKFNNMTYENVYDYWDYQLANISIGKIEKLKSEDLTTGYDEYIKRWNEGTGIGFRISSGLLNYQLAGIHKKNLLLHLAGIGQGKTSSAIEWYVLPTIESQDVCIIANEQDVDEWRKMVLATVLFNRIKGVKGINRHSLLVGNFTDQQLAYMKQATDWLERQPGRIHFIETQDYDIQNVKKIMSKYSKIGVSLFLVDTLKPQNDASERSWGEFSEVAKELFLQSKKLDVAVVATCQLSSDSLQRKFLDLSCVGKSRAIAETASTVVMFRPINTEEKAKLNQRNAVWNWRDKIRENIQLSEDRDYIMVFTPKNRYGQVSPQIVMERNMNFNSYTDIGWVECEYDQFIKR